MYGAEFSIDAEKFSWRFFLKADSRNEALTQGEVFLLHLKQLYPGIEGKVSAKKIERIDLNTRRDLYEIVLPRPPFTQKFFIVKKIISIFEANDNNRIQIYVVWQRDDSKVYSMEKSNYYKIKIYACATSGSAEESVTKENETKLKSLLLYFTTDVQEGILERPKLRDAHFYTWSWILKGSPFWKNDEDVYTGSCYRDILNQLPEERIPGFVTPDIVDFSIPSDIPIDKASVVRNEKVNFSKIIDKNGSNILLGNLERKGNETQRKMHFDLETFVHHVFIAGLSGAGKSRFLGHLASEFKTKSPEVGVLILNLLKKDEEGLYDSDIALKYGDPSFQVPYYFKGDDVETTADQVAAYLTASLGLKNVVYTNMCNVLTSYINRDGEPPKTVKECFNGLVAWFERNNYHEKYQTNILRAIKNRAIKLLASPILEKILELPAIIPLWFRAWRSGKTVFIDLSHCNTSTKRLLTNAILQMIRTLTPDIKTGALKSVVILDEANQVLERPTIRSSEDDESVEKDHLEKIFTEFLVAFRSRGISLMIADQKPSRLFESAYSLPSVQILFRTAHSCSKLFTNDTDEQDALALQKNRRATVFDGVNGQKFAFYTVDHHYRRTFEREKLTENQDDLGNSIANKVSD